MELVKFRIRNYKSIVDSGDCYFSDGITILAGKNESGKTSILEALEDFHEDNEIRESAIPLDREENPEIAITFYLTKKQINEIFTEAGLENTLKKESQITLVKKYGIEGYSMDDETLKIFSVVSNLEKTRKFINEILQEINNTFKDSNIPEIEFLEDESFEELKAKMQLLKSNTNALSAENRDDVILKIDVLEKELEHCDDVENNHKLLVDAFVNKYLPYFILFSSFEDEFPDSIAISELVNDEWAKDLEVVSKFSIEKITATNEQKREIHEKEVNIDFDKKFQKFWTQDNIKLEVKRDGDAIKFKIIENNIPYYPHQRSKGQQWYLGFYIRIVARINEDKPNVILIDEPGLYLHAKAQKDLLRVLKKHSPQYPVVFSTHSPYLIEDDNLEAVRLVEKQNNVKGSQILGKIHAHHTADKETLTPILTAIGLGLNDSIVNLEQKNNVVVEGPSDVFYLQAFKKIYSEKCRVNFINGGGAPNMAIVGSVLEGWGANVMYLFDNDSGRDQGIKKLNKFKVLKEKIKEVINKDDSAIEDIFSSQDFKKYILENEKLRFSSKNSVYVKNKDKVLLARTFLQNIDSSIKLSTESKNNIQALLAKLEF